jgi:uncharacterized protein (TIGR03382 family)
MMACMAFALSSPDVMGALAVFLTILSWLMRRRFSAKFLCDRNDQNWRAVRIASLVDDTAFALAMLLFVFSETFGMLPGIAMLGVALATTMICGFVRPAKLRRDPPDSDAP